MTETLVLERRSQEDATVVYGNEHASVMLTPPVNADYWEYRVRVADGQAVVGFPKFGTVGVGFAVEDEGDESSWNTNLPFTQETAKIVEHIWCNRGSALSSLSEDEARVKVITAVRLVQSAAFEDSIAEANRTDNANWLARLIERRIVVFGVPVPGQVNPIVDSGMCV